MAQVRGVTIRDISKSMKVSITTVSKVINNHKDISEETRKKVLDKISELGYVPNIMATNLRKTKTNLVALVLSDISKPYFAKVIAGYENTLEAAGYQTMTFSSMEQGLREHRFVQQIIAMNLAGIIIDPAQDSNFPKNALVKAGIPFVFSNRYLEIDSDYYVVADNEMAGYIATKHLLERKPNGPAICINGPNGISPTITRNQGYIRALQEAGKLIEERLIYNNCFDSGDAYQYGLRIIKEHQSPFSVFCSTDQFAIGILRALYECGCRVPADVSVIGVDDIDMARYMTPALTTVSLPKERIGEESAKMLISLMEGNTPESYHVLLQPELIVRETT